MFSLDLSQEFKEKRALGLMRLITQDAQDHLPRYAKIKEHRALADGSISDQMPIPWAGASQINVPLIAEKTNTIVPMIVGALLGVDPIVSVQRAPDEYDGEETDHVEQFMNFAVEKDIPGFYEAIEMAISDMVPDGMSYLKPYWKHSTRTVSEIHTVKTVYDLGAVSATGQEVEEAREKSALDMLADIFGMPVEDGSDLNGMFDAQMTGPEDLLMAMQMIQDEGSMPPAYVGKEVVGQTWEVLYIDERERKHATVEFIDSPKIDEIRLRVRKRITAEDNPVVDNIEYEDLILPYRTKDIQTADRVAHRYWLTVDEIKRKRREGWEISDDDLAILKGRSTRQQTHQEVDPGLQDQKDAYTGEAGDYSTERPITLPEGFEEYNRNKVLCFDVYLADDIGNGEQEEVVYTIIWPLRRIVHAVSLTEQFPHGRRPFIQFKYGLVTNRDYGTGIGDKLAAINIEINAIINLINNNQALVNNPWFLYEPASFNPTGISGISPGEGIPVADVNAVKFPNFPISPLSDMSMVTSLLMFSDRLTVSPLHGGSTQMKNAPRTARGTLALMSEGNMEIDMIVNRLQRTAWMELMEQIFGLYQEYMPDEKWYWVIREGRRTSERMSRTILRGRYEFNFKGNTVNTNREALRTIAQVRYNTLMANPDVNTDPHVRRYLVENFLKYFGDGADKDRLIPSLPGEGSYMHAPMRQQNENKILELGGWVAPLPNDMHAEHLQAMDIFERSPQFEAMEPHAVGLWAAHKQQHMEMLRTQAQTATLPAQGAGMANNVPTGETMASGPQGGLSVLQGGNS